MNVIVRIKCAILMLVLGGCATPPRATVSTGSHYVAMGSSFAAGAGIAPAKPDTPQRCQRAAINYATLLAQRLDLTLTDVTCGGATTAHVLGPWDELPPQIDAITPDTSLVTITIGGNDLGYVMGLMGGSCRAGAPLLPGLCFPNAVPAEEAYARLETSLREIARQVETRAPQAKLVFVQYVTLVPPTPCLAAILTAEDAIVSRAIGERLSAITAKVARETHSMLLPANELSRDHTACSERPWNSGMSRGYDLSRGAPWHPTAEGMRAIADVLAEDLSRP